MAGPKNRPPAVAPRLAELVEDVIDGERLADREAESQLCRRYPVDQSDVAGRSEQLYRVLSNLVRNARQAIAATGQPGEIASALRGRGHLVDPRHRYRPGPAAKAREHLFQPSRAAPPRAAPVWAWPSRRTGARPWRPAELRRTDETGTAFAILTLRWTRWPLPNA